MKDRGGNRRGSRHTQRKRESPIPSPFSPLPIKKRTPASESANPSSQHQLDGFIVLILAKRRKVNHSRFWIATQKPPREEAAGRAGDGETDEQAAGPLIRD